MASSKLLVPDLATVQIKGMTRESFLLRGTLAAGAVFGATAVSPFVTEAFSQEDSGDVDILNFALTLEFLEATFYDRALDEVSGLSDEQTKLAEELRDNEQEHVDALRSTIEQLGGQPVEEPEFDFGDAYSDVETFLRTSNILEDTGVSAYNGAAPEIESTEVLAAAGSIVQVEARHASLIRLQRGVSPSPRAFDKASTMDEVLEAVMPFVQS